MGATLNRNFMSFKKKYVGSSKLVVVGIFTSWKSANYTNLEFIFSPENLLPVDQWVFFTWDHSGILFNCVRFSCSLHKV